VKTDKNVYIIVSIGCTHHKYARARACVHTHHTHHTHTHTHTRARARARAFASFKREFHVKSFYFSSYHIIKNVKYEGWKHNEKHKQ